jgi:hypothetical protein
LVHHLVPDGRQQPRPGPSFSFALNARHQKDEGDLGHRAGAHMNLISVTDRNYAPGWSVGRKLKIDKTCDPAFNSNPSSRLNQAP